MKARLVIEAELDTDNLTWKDEAGNVIVPDNIVALYNQYYEQFPEEAFELALQDSRFLVTDARIEVN